MEQHWRNTRENSLNAEHTASEKTTYGSNSVTLCAIRDSNNLQNKLDPESALPDLGSIDKKLSLCLGGRHKIVWIEPPDRLIWEAVVKSCSVKKVFLKILQNSQENTCARVSFLKNLQTAPAALLKNRLWHMCFPVSFAKFLRNTFFYRTPPVAASIIFKAPKFTNSKL